MNSPSSSVTPEIGTTPTAQDATAFLRRRRWLFVFVALAILLSAIVLAFRLPPIYQSEAKVLIEQPSIPEDIVASTITNYVDERIQAVSQRVLAADNVLAIIDKFGLYPDLRAQGSNQTAISQFRDDTYLENIATEIFDARRGRMDGSTFAFVVGFRGSDPQQIRDVTGELVQLYLDENAKSRTERSAETTLFLQQEADLISEEISKTEREMADYKAQYSNALPERLQLNVQLLDRTERELADVDERIRRLTSERELLRLGLQAINPHAAVISSTGTTVLSARERLDVLQLEYLRLTATYGPEHPDVVRTKREIDSILGSSGNQRSADLERQLLALRLEREQLLERYSSEHPDVQQVQRSIASVEAQIAESPPLSGQARLDAARPNNPEYIQHQLQLDSATENLRAANAERAQLIAKRSELENSIAAAPRVEKEWLELNRGYQSAKEDFNQIMRRISDAVLSERLESQNKGERFILLERASLPNEPIEPDRSAIIFLGVVLALGVGIAVAALADGLDSTVRGSRDLEIIFAATPLVAVPFIETRADKHRRYFRQTTAAGAIVLSLFTVYALV